MCVVQAGYSWEDAKLQVEVMNAAGKKKRQSVKKTTRDASKTKKCVKKAPPSSSDLGTCVIVVKLIALTTPVFTDSQQPTMKRSVSFPLELKKKHKTAESETEFDSSSSEDDEGYHSEADSVDDAGC